MRGAGEGGGAPRRRRGVDFRVALVVCSIQRAVVRRPWVLVTPAGAAVQRGTWIPSAQTKACSRRSYLSSLSI